VRYVIVSIICGVLFGAMDGLINANPLARRLLEVYKPIARTSINVPAGIAIDLMYGFILAALFLFLYSALPGTSALVKGLSFALLVWFLRVVTYALSQWMTVPLSWQAVAYLLVTGLLEMAVLGVLFGFALRPR
jgi:hypothetical protein